MRNLTAAMAVVLLTAAGTASAAEINAMVTTAMKAALDELVPQFEHRSAHKVHVTYGPSGGLARRLRSGEKADFILIAAPELDKLMQQDKVLPGSTEINRTGIGIAVRKGAPRPDVSTPEALKRALLAAKSVGHTAPAGGSVTAMPLLKMFEKLGIASEVAAKTKLAAGGPNGRVSVLVSSGEAEIGMQQVSELMSNPDVDVVGLLPDALQQITVHRAAVTVDAKEPDPARALISFLESPDAMAIYKKKGLGL